MHEHERSFDEMLSGISELSEQPSLIIGKSQTPQMKTPGVSYQVDQSLINSHQDLDSISQLISNLTPLNIGKPGR